MLGIWFWEIETDVTEDEVLREYDILTVCSNPQSSSTLRIELGGARDSTMQAYVLLAPHWNDA
jgi:hypothetical protein